MAIVKKPPAGGGGGAVAGADTQIQWNDGGSDHGASANFTFDDATDLVTINNTVGGDVLILEESGVQRFRHFANGNWRSTHQSGTVQLTASSSTARVNLSSTGDFQLSAASGITFLEIESARLFCNKRFDLINNKTINSSPADDNAAGIIFDPSYDAVAAQTVTRHNYAEYRDVSTDADVTVTDACTMRFDAAAGTHLAVDAATTKTTPGGVDAWIKININGTIFFMPAYLSKTT